MDSKLLLYGIQCSFESMLVLIILVTLYFQRLPRSYWSLSSIILWHSIYTASLSSGRGAEH